MVVGDPDRVGLNVRLPEVVRDAESVEVGDADLDSVTDNDTVALADAVEEP